MKNRLYLSVLWILLPLAAAVRVWQLSAAVDEAGFYKEPYVQLCNTLGYVLLGFMLIMVLAGRYWLNKHPVLTPPRKSIPLGTASLVLAVSSIPQALADQMDTTTPAQQLFAIVCAGGIGVCFAVVAACQLMGKKVPFGIIVVPVVCQLFRVYVNYARFNGIAQISENVISILFLSSFLVFSLAICRVYSGIDSGKGLSWAYSTGGCTALFGLLSTLPHWILGQGDPMTSALNLGAAVYALTFVSVMGLAKPVPAAEASAELTAEDTVAPLSEGTIPTRLPVAEDLPVSLPQPEEINTETVSEDHHNLSEE